MTTHSDLPVIARHRKRGTRYVAVTPGVNPSYSMVTTTAGSTYIVRSESIEYLMLSEETT